MRRHAHANPIVWGADIDLIRANVRLWPLASFRCLAKFGRYGGIADIGRRWGWTNSDIAMAQRSRNLYEAEMVDFGRR